MSKYFQVVSWLSPLIVLNSLLLPLQAQTQVPACDPPAENTYLLLIRDASRSTQKQLSLVLPENIDLPICQYLDQEVIRLGAFTSLETADQWGQFLREIGGVQAVIATTTMATTPTPPATPPAPQAFNPQPLDPGYAVLVNYFNEPETATQLRDFLDKEIGLVSYLARPYLLAWQTESEAEANRILQRLSQQGFWAVVVDRDRATLLTPTVEYSEPTPPPETP